MAVPQARAGLSAGLAVAAAFLWATYYLFVLTISSGAAAVVALPFVVGGLAFLVLALWEGHGSAFLALWRSPMAYVRALFVIGMQTSVLAGTYVAGPIDTSLLSLVGDVCLTPILLIGIYREGLEHARAPPFLAGLVLSTIGASLTIVGGQGTEPLAGWGWLVAIGVPLTVALYFLFTARASRTVPVSAVNAQALLAGALGTLLLAPLFPGGFASLSIPSLHDAAFLVALGLTSFFLAVLLYFRAIEVAGLLLPATMMATIPLFTVLVTYVAFGDVPTQLALLGIPMAVVGGLLALRGSHEAWTPDYATAPSAPPS
jgi:hypothetical protein